MKKQYLTNEARLSAINEIGKLINKLGKVKDSELDYIFYREIVQYLCNYKEVIKEEMEIEKMNNKINFTIKENRYGEYSIILNDNLVLCQFSRLSDCWDFILRCGMLSSEDGFTVGKNHISFKDWKETIFA